MEFLGDGWREPDDGIWEVRGPRRHFTHSKVMAWVAIDRAIRTLEEHDLEGPVDQWKKMREEIHDQVCDQGFNADKGSFTQYYGSDQLDASLLMIPLVGFLPAHDPRVRGTIEAIERELVDGGFVLRYRTVDTGDVDGLTGREGAFLACSFWLADCLLTARARPTTPASSSIGCSGCATTSGCCPRSTTLWPGGWWATSRRRSPTSPWSTRPAKLSGHGKPTAPAYHFAAARRASGGSKSGADTIHRAAPHRPAPDGRP